MEVDMDTKNGKGMDMSMEVEGIEEEEDAQDE
eukprot:s7291_g1.t1